MSELTNAVRTALEAGFTSVWVEGEISNFKAHSSGHWYFTIKDEAAQLRAKCFRSANARIRFRPTDGLHVRARGRLSVYAPRGEYEMVVESLDPIGAGALRIAFEQLRALPFATFSTSSRGGLAPFTCSFHRHGCRVKQPGPILRELSA